MHVEKQADFLKRSFFPDRLSWESAGGGNRSGERRSLMLAEKQAELLKRSFFPIGFLGRAREGVLWPPKNLLPQLLFIILFVPFSPALL